MSNISLFEYLQLIVIGRENDPETSIESLWKDTWTQHLAPSYFSIAFDVVSNHTESTVVTFKKP